MTKVFQISVVDDDESVRESLLGLLRSVGFAVSVFSRCEDFLVSASVPKTECLILDVHLPGGMSGPDLQGQLLALGSAIPIVFITARRDENVRSRVLADGAVDYLIKPFSEEALLKAVHIALRMT